MKYNYHIMYLNGSSQLHLLQRLMRLTMDPVFHVFVDGPQVGQMFDNHLDVGLKNGNIHVELSKTD